MVRSECYLTVCKALLLLTLLNKNFNCTYMAILMSSLAAVSELNTKGQKHSNLSLAWHVVCPSISHC